jgi:hypothetical protein
MFAAHLAGCKFDILARPESNICANAIQKSRHENAARM